MWNTEEVKAMNKNFFNELNILPVNQKFSQIAKDHIEKLTMPPWALGDLLNLGVQLSSIQEQFPPKINHKTVYVFAGDNGITDENISLFPKIVTEQMVRNFASGGAAINVLSRHAGAETVIVDVGVDADLEDLSQKGLILNRKIRRGTYNFFEKPSMSLDEALQSLQVGLDLVKESCHETDLYAIGEMGIGNTTTSSALLSALLDKDPDQLTGKGTGLDDQARLHKVEIIRESLKRRSASSKDDPLTLLQKIGSFEIGAMVGMVLGCALYRRPLLMDGLISSTAGLLASRINKSVTPYLFLAHKSVEPGHMAIIEELQLKPLLDLNMRLGEGSGTPLAMNLLEASSKIMAEMATFESAQVSGQKEEGDKK